MDADACPAVIREILFRAAERSRVELTMVANRPLKLPRSPYLKMRTVSSGFDVADNEIVRLVEPGDLVITGDIPLAAEVIEKGGHALNPRGELYSVNSIRQRLNMRDFMDTMRASGIHGGGQAPLNQTERREFANHLDRILARAEKS